MNENFYPAEKTLLELMEETGITATVREGGPPSPTMPNHCIWTVTFRRVPPRSTVPRSRTFSVPFYSNTEPTGNQVLACVLSEGVDVFELSFEEWAENLGYDPDSRKIERIYQQCQKNRQRLEAFLGEDLYQSFLEAE